MMIGVSGDASIYAFSYQVDGNYRGFIRFYIL